MTKIALAASLALLMFGSAQASVAEVAAGRGPAGLPLTLPVVAAANLPASGGAGGIVVLQSATSELAEPEMFAMMLLGLVLIGYRATRDSSEKFK
ncbi:hypothetical protein [Massilia sp. TWR1-2-2]|uniref:hypothetical protein n=1 Tax=Massilia sp. TWR1-2-2 TaxID=2804584 RepID=UPI003CE8A7DF